MIETSFNQKQSDYPTAGENDNGEDIVFSREEYFIGSPVQITLSFRKSMPAIYWQYAKMKLGFGLTEKQKSNRKRFADAMKKAGFFPLSYEWWHFNGMPKAEARSQFRVIE